MKIFFLVVYIKIKTMKSWKRTAQRNITKSSLLNLYLNMPTETKNQYTFCVNGHLIRRHIYMKPWPKFALREQHQKTGNHNASNSLWRMRFSAVKYALSKETGTARSSYPLQVAELSLYVVQRCDAGSFRGWMYIRDKSRKVRRFSKIRTKRTSLQRDICVHTHTCARF